MADQNTPPITPVDLSGGLVPRDPIQVAPGASAAPNVTNQVTPVDLTGGLVPKDQAAPKPQDDTGVWAGIKRNTVGAVTGLYHALTAPATEDEKASLLEKVRSDNTKYGDNIPESLATDPSQVTLAYHRLIDAPADYLHKKGGDEQVAAKDLLSKGQAWKGANLYLSGVVDKGLSAVPLAGPTINEIAERFESGDKSGAATDLAAIVAAENAPKIVKAGGKAINKLTGSSMTGKVAEALDASAQKNYEQVLNPSKETTKYQTQQIMPKLLEERPIAMTRKGLAEKAATHAEQAGQEIEQTVQNLQGTMRTQPVIDGLQNLKDSFRVKGVSLRPEVDSVIDSVSDQMKQMGSDISLQEAVQARRILDDAVAEAKGYQGAQLSDASLAKIRKAAANSIRNELGQASPDLATVNAKFHFWNTLNDVMEQTIKRKTGQAPSMRETIQTAAMAGSGLIKGGVATAGEYAAAMSVLGKVFRSTAWHTVSAATKASLADALASGNFSQAAELASKAAAPGVIAGTGQEKKSGEDWVPVQFQDDSVHEIHLEDVDKALKQNPGAKVISEKE